MKLHDSGIATLNDWFRFSPPMGGEKQWKDGEWKQYLKDRYCFVRFGVNCNDQ